MREVRNQGHVDGRGFEVNVLFATPLSRKRCDFKVYIEIKGQN